MSDYKINTKCVQAGYEPKNGEPCGPHRAEHDL